MKKLTQDVMRRYYSRILPKYCIKQIATNKEKVNRYSLHNVTNFLLLLSPNCLESSSHFFTKSLLDSGFLTIFHFTICEKMHSSLYRLVREQMQPSISLYSKSKINENRRDAFQSNKFIEHVYMLQLISCR